MKIKPHQRINKQTDSDKLQGVIRNPFAFYFPIQRGFSRSIQTLASKMTHAKPIQTRVAFAWLFG